MPRPVPVRRHAEHAGKETAMRTRSVPVDRLVAARRLAGAALAGALLLGAALAAPAAA